MNSRVVQTGGYFISSCIFSVLVMFFRGHIRGIRIRRGYLFFPHILGITKRGNVVHFCYQYFDGYKPGVRPWQIPFPFSIFICRGFLEVMEPHKSRHTKFFSWDLRY